MTKILIIGGVAAGATAAARVRRLDENASITVLEAGADVSFANCGLPYYIGGEIEYRSSLILQSPQSFYDQYRVFVHTNTEAKSIDRNAKTVIAYNALEKTEKTYNYDVLILAQGGKPIVPPLPGVEQDNVFQLWTLDDMDAIDTFIKEKKPKTAVVVGGGFIGLEMIEALVNRELKVSLVEMAPQVMPNLEAEIAGFLTEELQAHSVALHLGTSLTKIKKNKVILSNKSKLDADLVLLSVGVKPTLQLAKDAGLKIGETGALLVDSMLRSSDPSIFAAGDMAEVENYILGKKVRIPLAGPANRQGRIAAENALGSKKVYKGSIGTSIVKLFAANAGSTGLSLTAAKAAGFDAEAVVVHKMSHTAYYPGSSPVTLMLIYEKPTGRVLGAQSAGYKGIDKRLDVIATAILGKLSVEDLSELDLAYAPPFNSPNGPVNMAAFTAENRRSGFSPSLSAAELDDYVKRNKPHIIDLRDPISFQKNTIYNSQNISLTELRDRANKLSRDQHYLLVSDDGQKGHIALRLLKGLEFQNLINLSGGFISAERYARAKGFAHLGLNTNPVEKKDLTKDVRPQKSKEESTENNPLSGSETLVIDVRTPMEFKMGAYPGAINITLDALPAKAQDILDKNREIVLYCATGARSAYGQRILKQMGFSNVKNGGGLSQMMARS